MGPTGDLVFVIAVLGVLAAWVIWGWKSWVRHASARASATAILSLVGFLIASLSALLQISTGIYAQFVFFPFNDPTLLKIYSLA
jgi:hypothetical protein